jgi:hypothetical protein
MNFAIIFITPSLTLPLKRGREIKNYSLVFVALVSEAHQGV